MFRILFLYVILQFHLILFKCFIYTFLHLLQMAVIGLLIMLIGVALVLRTSTPIKRGCAPTGFRDFEPLIEFMEEEDTGLLGLYVLYSPKKSRKLEPCLILGANHV